MGGGEEERGMDDLRREEAVTANHVPAHRNDATNDEKQECDRKYDEEKHYEVDPEFTFWRWC